jgi:hypothetical protein
MELLLKRNETSSGFGTRYDLFAKLELKAEEQILMQKAKPEQAVIWEDNYSKNNLRWRLMLIPAAIGALILAMLASWLFSPFLFIPVGIIALFALRRLFFKQMTGDITVADIVTGRTIHCKSMDELLVKENDIREKIKRYCNNLEAWHSLGNEQRIDLSRS